MQCNAIWNMLSIWCCVMDLCFMLCFMMTRLAVYTTFTFLKNEIIKYIVSCILYPVCQGDSCRASATPPPVSDVTRSLRSALAQAPDFDIRATPQSLGKLHSPLLAALQKCRSYQYLSMTANENSQLDICTLTIEQGVRQLSAVLCCIRARCKAAVWCVMLY